MTLREDLLPLVDACRQITEELDQRTTGLTIRVRTWSGSIIGQTAEADSEIVIATSDTPNAVIVDPSDFITVDPSNFILVTDSTTAAVQVNSANQAIQVEKSFSDADLIFPRRYHCRILSDKDTAQIVTASAGRFGPGRYVKMWMTPSFPGGGYQQTDLVPVVNDDSQEVIYLLSGLGLNGEYTLVSFNSDRPYRYEMILRQKNVTSRP